ncbi:hypothetical protein [Chitinilyticum litopenaei]|uniref:hypothetical protein n=1 Tax=Chitinilyticum litopenaei TaxID=1121276 RepID=UPI001185A5A5|nr:hypothetical protein [Chitinilyticum litopenaei]
MPILAAKTVVNFHPVNRLSVLSATLPSCGLLSSVHRIKIDVYMSVAIADKWLPPYTAACIYSKEMHDALPALLPVHAGCASLRGSA